MNLEAIEQRCYLLLTAADNPLVPFEVVYAHVVEDPDCAEISSEELLKFLRNHALFRVVDPMTFPAESGTVSSALPPGISVSPRVILRDRVPTPSQLAEQMLDELAALASALNRALEEARRTGNDAAARQSKRLLERVDSLRKKLNSANEPDSSR